MKLLSILLVLIWFLYFSPRANSDYFGKSGAVCSDLQ